MIKEDIEKETTAYAQGADIYIASGQEKHLPHEAWHAAQQKQVRVLQPSDTKLEIEANNDFGLEKEAE